MYSLKSQILSLQWKFLGLKEKVLYSTIVSGPYWLWRAVEIWITKASLLHLNGLERKFHYFPICKICRAKGLKYGSWKLSINKIVSTFLDPPALRRKEKASSSQYTTSESWNKHSKNVKSKQQEDVGALEPWLPAPRAATSSCLRDENYFENQGQRPQAYICSRLLTWVCHGPSQSESNFINTVIKQKGNYFKYWKNVRVIHEFCGYHILFDTQWINDSKEICSEIIYTTSLTFKLNLPYTDCPSLEREIIFDLFNY